MKKRMGFTLVELAVVMAIIGVLAAILIPILMGYIAKSRQAQANADAKTIFNNLGTYSAELDFKNDDTTLPDGIYYYGDNVSGALSSSVMNSRIEQYTNGVSSVKCILVKFTNGHFPKVVVSNGGSDRYYGCYPNALTGEQEIYKTGAIKLLS